MSPLSRPPADWQMPEGVNRGLWDYLHDGALARGYDASLAGSALFDLDQHFVDRHCPPNPTSPTRLLDLGCGTGRLLLRQASRGWWVLGVDLSAEMLGVASSKAREAGLSIHLLRANLANLDGLASATFDHAACLFSTLGMVLGAKVRQRVLHHVYRLLRPGGRFVLHVHNRWQHLWTGPGRRWLLRDLVRTCTGNPEAGDRVMPVHQGIAGLTLHLFTRREVLAGLRQAGFRLVAFEPVAAGPHGRLRWPWLLPGLRATGFLIAAQK